MRFPTIEGGHKETSKMPYIAVHYIHKKAEVVSCFMDFIANKYNRESQLHHKERI